MKLIDMKKNRQATKIEMDEENEKIDKQPNIYQISTDAIIELFVSKFIYYLKSSKTLLLGCNINLFVFFSDLF